MYLREHLHDQLDMVAVIGPADPAALDRLGDAIREHILSPAGRPLYRRATPRYGWGRLARSDVPAAINSVLTVVEPGMSTAEMATVIAERGFAVLPISIMVSGRYSAWMFPHDLFDGTSGWEHILGIIDRALGVDASGEQPKPLVKRPVIEALQNSKLTSSEALLKGRADRREAERVTATAPQVPGGVALQRSRRLAGHHYATLTHDQLSYIDRTIAAPRDGAPALPARATRGMRLVEVAIDTFDALADPAVDYRIRLSVDLRRYLPRGTRAAGAFSTAYPVGTLRTTDNTAATLTARFAGILRRKEPLIALVADLAGVAKGTVRHPIAAVKGGRGAHRRDTLDLTLSVFPCPVPDAFWDAAGRSPESAIILLHPIEVTGPFIQISEMSGHAVLSIWDESGTMNLADFDSALADTVASRVVPSRPAPRPAAAPAPDAAAESAGEPVGEPVGAREDSA